MCVYVTMQTVVTALPSVTQKEEKETERGEPQFYLFMKHQHGKTQRCHVSAALRRKMLPQGKEVLSRQSFGAAVRC